MGVLVLAMQEDVCVGSCLSKPKFRRSRLPPPPLVSKREREMEREGHEEGRRWRKREMDRDGDA